MDHRTVTSMTQEAGATIVAMLLALGVTALVPTLLALSSTLTSVSLYAAHGWKAHERLQIPLPDG